MDAVLGLLGLGSDPKRLAAGRLLAADCSREKTVRILSTERKVLYVPARITRKHNGGYLFLGLWAAKNGTLPPTFHIPEDCALP